MRHWQRLELLGEDLMRAARHTLPQGVVNAEAILEEERKREMSVLAEAIEGACMHDDMSVYRVIKDLSDIETDYGCCLRCGQWLVRTTDFTADTTTDRPMTEAEQVRLRAYEDSQRMWRD